MRSATVELPITPTPFAAPSPMPVAELAIHALAQLHDSVELELASCAGRGLLGEITEAYGLRRRVRFGSTPGDRTGCFLTSEGDLHVEELLPATLAQLVERIGGGVASPIDASNDGVLAGERMVVVTNYPAHYRVPLLRGMARRLAVCGAEMHVMFLSDRDAARPWLVDGSAFDFEHEFLRSVRMPVRQRAPLVPKGLEKRLRAFRPTIVLSTGFSPFVSYRAVRTARDIGAKFGVWSGETAVMPTAQQRSRRLARRRMVQMTDFSIAYGMRAAAYLRGLRADLPIVIGRNTAPVPDKRSETSVRQLPAGIELVLIGDLASPRKGVDIVIQAMRLVPDLDLRLSVIGGGKLLGRLAEDAGSDGRIRFLGPLPPDEVRSRLQQADVLLFPTRADVFGLVLVEAMGSGLATIVSSSAGAVDDLAVNGFNAVVVADPDPAEWSGAIRALVEDRAMVDRLGAAARRTIVSRWSMEHAVDAMIAGLRLGAACQRVN